jgi:hypothetical protein
MHNHNFLTHDDFHVNITPNVATLLLEEWEDDIHTPEMGTWESSRTSETLEFDCKGQNTLH